MYRFVKELKGKNVKIKEEGAAVRTAKVLDCDDEWLKIEETAENGASITLIRLSVINEINVVG